MSDDIKQVIVVRMDLNMRKGKLAAQVAHASSAFLVDAILKRTTHNLPQEAWNWMFDAHTKIVLGVDSEEELDLIIGNAQYAGLMVHTVIDAGRTEFNGVATLTCAAIGPDHADKIDAITGGLRLI